MYTYQMEPTNEYDICKPDCPSREVLDLIANKWTVRVLHILNRQTLRYNELKRKIPGISQKVLTGVLRNLEESGIITRTVYPVIPPKVEYTITKLGATLLVSIESLQQWAEAHIPEVQKAREVYRNKLHA